MSLSITRIVMATPESAVTYRLMPSLTAFKTNAARTVVQECSVSAVMINGSDAPQQMTSAVNHLITVTGYTEAGNFAFYANGIGQIVFNTNSMALYSLPARFELSLLVNNVVVDKITIPVIIDGAKGAQGAKLRNLMPWASFDVGFNFLSGAEGEEWYDVVLDDDNNKYICKTSHVKTADNYPGSTIDTNNNLWKTGEDINLLTTAVHFSKESYVDNLVVGKVITGAKGTPHVEMYGGVFEIYSWGQFPFFRLETGANGKGVLRCYDEDTGEFLYDLGPQGILNNFEEVADAFVQTRYKYIGESERFDGIKTVADSDCTVYYRYDEGYKVIAGASGGNVIKYHVSDSSTASPYNGVLFTSDAMSANASYGGRQAPSGTVMPDGWYMAPTKGSGAWKQYYQGDTLLYWWNTLYRFVGGRISLSVKVRVRAADYSSGVPDHIIGCDANGKALLLSKYKTLWQYGMEELKQYV